MKHEDHTDSKAQLEHERENQESEQKADRPLDAHFDKKLDGPNRPAE